MNIQFVVFSNQQTGQGHYFRCEALAKAALDAGHKIMLIGDKRFSFLRQKDFRPWSYGFFKAWNEREHLIGADSDWLVVDLPFNLSSRSKTKTCILNGIGYSLEYSHDLSVIQGLIDEPMPENVVSGTKYVILRPEIENIKEYTGIKSKWFVWGGSEDTMGLLPEFPYWTNASLYHSAERYGKQYYEHREKNPLLLLKAMSAHTCACVAMGMAVWELIYLGIPTWVFSATETHLKFAKALHNKGLINAWDGVGLPSQNKIKDFLSQPFEIDCSQEKPDLLAAKRILILLEEQL
jgi:hypothetical protein